jgi:hypothetical protein
MEGLMIWYIALGILCFGLGLTFGFLLSVRASGSTTILIVKASSVIGLSILAKCIENYSYANLVKLDALRKSGVEPDDKAYKLEKENQEKIMNNFKEDSIKFLVNAHSGIFKEIAPYTDWRSAMRFLEKNRELAILFRKGAES